MEEERTQLMEKFQEITQIQENHVSRHFLESVNWDLNLAIQNYLESHLDEKAGEATTSSLPRSQPQRQGETEELGTEEAPFSIEDNQQGGFLFQMISWPLRMLFQSLYYVFQLTSFF